MRYRKPIRSPDGSPRRRRHAGECRCRNGFHNGDLQLTRELVSGLEAWDVGAGCSVRLETGQAVTAYRIERLPVARPGIDPYVVEFESGGRSYTCPLYRYQARAQVVQEETVEAIPEPSAAAV
jgi:TPP-dependent pyruvate/acetoin dehydrogenase alpha subunit